MPTSETPLQDNLLLDDFFPFPSLSTTPSPHLIFRRGCRAITKDVDVLGELADIVVVVDVLVLEVDKSDAIVDE